MKIFDSENNYSDSKIILYNLTLSNKKPFLELKKFSREVETYDLDLKKNVLELNKLFDYDFLEVKKVEKIKEWIKDRKVPIGIFNCHLLTYFVIKCVNPKRLLIFDSHADLKNNYEDNIVKKINGSFYKKSFNEATWLRRLIEEYKIKTLIVGLNSLDEFEYEYMKIKNVDFISSSFIKENLNKAFIKIKKFLKKNSYLSLDLDFFNPSIIDNLSYPEPFGLEIFHFQKILPKKIKISGADINGLENISKREAYLAILKILLILISRILI